MRKLLLSFTLLLPLSLVSQVTYHHYFDSTYQWFEYHSYYIFPTFQPPCYLDGLGQIYSRYHVIGEDTIDGHAWYQIHYDDIEEIYCGSNTQPTVVIPHQSPSFLFRIREDSLGNIWQRYGQQTRLLYEFQPGMGIGDTLWMDDHLVTCVIDSMDTLYFGADPRHRYWCECDSGSLPEERDFVVEGVGFSGSFEQFFAFCGPLYDNNTFIVCAEKGADTLVLNSTVDCGRPQHNPVAVDRSLLEALHVTWLPIEEVLQLRTSALLPDFEWDVLDIQGKIICQGEGLQGRIFLPSIPNGLYIFRGESQGRQQVLKFIK